MFECSMDVYVGIRVWGEFGGYFVGERVGRASFSGRFMSERVSFIITQHT